MVALFLAAVAALSLRSLAAATLLDDYAPAPTDDPSPGYDDALGYGGKASRTTFLEATATNANPVASGQAVDHGKAYVKYSVVPGLFQQDSNATNASTFDYTTTNFGLLNRTYPSDPPSSSNLTQWQRFDRYLTSLNRHSPRSVQYKLLFIGRHGEGYHNAAESFYGTPAWNCYWAEANGNSTASWADARLTATGLAQAAKAAAYWARLRREQRIVTPQSFYVSPLTRCLQTAQATFGGLALPARGRGAFVPTVKELLREGISAHTCDRRADRGDIAARYPGYAFERSFAEEDELWSGVVAETSSAQDYRSKVVLDDVFGGDANEVLSFTSHSGETASILRVVGHIPFSLSTGAVIPLLVRAETVRATPPSVTTTPWTTTAWCTNAPPVTSVAGTGCVCRDGVTPTAVSPGSVFTTNPAKL